MTKIHPTAIVAAGAEIADDAEIGPYCILGDRVKLGPRCQLRSHVVIEGVTEIGADCVIYPFVSLGAAPQHAAHRGEATRLVLGERNLIREHVTMHSGTVLGGGVTRVGSDGLFYVGCHVAHDCMVGDHVILTNSAALGGHVVIEDFAILGGLSAVAQHLRIGRYAFVGGCAGVHHDVIPFGNVWGNPAHMKGLNLIGMKRHGFSRDEVNTLRAAYRLLFADEGTFQERVEDAAQTYADSPGVMGVIEFIRAEEGRPIIMPARDL